ncbi:hypothetical protein Tco_0753883 [Tanacetum coccineum]
MMLLNFHKTIIIKVDQYKKQLTKIDFKEDGAITAFWGGKQPVQKFIDSKFTLDYDSQMTDTQYKRRVNKEDADARRGKIDTGKALDADLVDTESIRTDSTVQDDSSRSGNDTYADDADIRPIYDEEPMAKV